MTELQYNSTEVEAQLGEVKDISLEIRAKVAAQLLQGQGSIEEIIRELAGALEKNVSFEAGETAEDLVVEVADSEPDSEEDEALKSEDLTPEDPRLASLKADFEKGLKVVKADGSLAEEGPDRTWEQCVERLNQSHHLNPEKKGWELALEIPGGAQLFAVDEEGRLCIKNRGQEPVIYKWIEGEDREKELATIINRNPDLISAEGEYANYWEVYEAVCGPENAATGYELFPKIPDYEKHGLVAAVEAFTGEDFIRSANGDTWRGAWLNNGRDVNKKLRYAYNMYFLPNARDTYVNSDASSVRSAGMGASLLLRV